MFLFAVLMALVPAQQWDESVNQNLKILQPERYEDAAKFEAFHITADIGREKHLPDLLHLSPAMKSDLKDFHVGFDEKLTESVQRDPTQLDALELLNNHVEAVRERLDAITIKRIEVLAIQVSVYSDLLQTERVVRRFEYPLLMKNVAGLSAEQGRKLTAETSAALKKYLAQRQIFTAISMKKVLSSISQNSREQFIELVGENRLYDLQVGGRHTSIQDAKQGIYKEFLSNEKLWSEIELLEHQKLEIEAVFERHYLELLDDPDYVAANAIFDAYVEAELEVPQDVEKKVYQKWAQSEKLAIAEIPGILLPVQRKILHTAAVQDFLMYQSKNPIRWPRLLSDELGLSSEEIKKLDDATKEAVEEFNRKDRELTDSLYREVTKNASVELLEYLKIYHEIAEKQHLFGKLEIRFGLPEPKKVTAKPDLAKPL